MLIKTYFLAKWNVAIKHNSFVKFLVIFTAVFLICYFGALFITGLSVAGGLYSPFIDKYFDATAWLRSSLIISSKAFLSWIGTETYRKDEYVLRATTGRGIRIVYSCLGYGIMSFWAAYVAATAARMRTKMLWLFGGLFLIWLINVLRLSMVLQGAVKGWRFPFGWDHHTWFNIITYMAVFMMMYLFERNYKRIEHQSVI